jgi:hypothetical protein
MRKLWHSCIALLLLALAPVVAAQGDVCPALVQQALQVVGESCGNLERNNACYGFNQINATFFQQQPDDYFNTPADRADLLTVASIQTSPLDVAQSRWGIAVVNVQANLPTMLPGAAALFLLMGDTQVTNAVPAGQAAIPVEPVAITTTGSLNLRSAPSTSANVLTSMPAGTQLLTDQRTVDGQWLRVVYNGVVGWVSRQVVSAVGNVDALPVPGSSSLGAMQAFSLKTGITGISCEEAPPSVLVIQAPLQTTLQITVNGLQLNISSTVVIQSNVQDGMQIGVIDGSVETDDGVQIPTGFTANYALDITGQGILGGTRDLRPFNGQELAQWAPLANIPSSLLHYPVDIPTLAEINTFVQGVRAAGTPAPAVPVGTPLSGTLTPTPTGQALIPLTVSTGPCVRDYFQLRDFTTFNPNGFEVPISWFTSSGESAFFFAPPNGSRTVTVTPPGDGYQTFAPVHFVIDWGTGTAEAYSLTCQR